MDNKNYDEEEIEIDLGALLFALRKKPWVVLLAGILGLVVMFAYTRFLVTPLYSATTMMYVLPTENNNNGYSSTLSDMQVGQQLTSDYASMIMSRSFMEDVIDNLKLDLDYTDLLGLVDVSSPSNSRILQVSVLDPDPEEAMNIANEVANVAEKKLAEITSMQATKIYEKAALPTVPSSPNLKKNCIIGGMAAAFLALVIIAVLFLMDDTIKSEEDIEKYLRTTTLAVIPYVDGKHRKKKSGRKTHQSAKKRKEKAGHEFN